MLSRVAITSGKDTILRFTAVLENAHRGTALGMTEEDLKEIRYARDYIRKILRQQMLSKPNKKETNDSQVNTTDN